MKTIVVLGAGKSATVLIDFLKSVAIEKNWHVWIADNNYDAVCQKIGDAPNVFPYQIDIHNEQLRHTLIEKADVVISLLPPSLHILVAYDCISAKKHLLNASYMSNEIKALNDEVTEKGLLFLCEMGLDPGIDHMSAMQLINHLKAEKQEIVSFKSHCGGLIAPENDDNFWHYKISWNPRNIILAGKAGATYIENGHHVSLDYQQLFSQTTTVEVNKLGTYAAYANRDSLSYMPLYHLENCHTFIRTTLRHPDFCKLWQTVVELQLTNEVWQQWNGQKVSYREYWESFLAFTKQSNANHILETLGLLSDEVFILDNAIPANVLQQQLEIAMQLHSHDKDMIIMKHEIVSKKDDQQYLTESTLVVKGIDNLHTAMAQTVGLPLGIAAVLLLEDRLTVRGVHIPIIKEIYEPVLDKLAEFGIVFKEKVTNL